jgi:integrase/recombinase XerD
MTNDNVTQGAGGSEKLQQIASTDRRNSNTTINVTNKPFRVENESHSRLPRNPKNERMKRQYSDFLKHADGKAEQTIRQVDKAIQRYEVFTSQADFGSFNQQRARAFKEELAGQNLAKATILSTVTSLKRFFGWLAVQPGFKQKISLSDVEFLSLSDKDIRAAKAPADRAIPTLEQVLHVVETMPAYTAIEKRNRALVAFIALTGTRDGAAVTLRLKHFDPARNLVIQNPNEVKTKFSKRICAFLLPVEDRLKAIFLDWVQYLKTELLFGNDDPLFPKTKMAQDENDCFKTDGLSRDFWANATPVRDIFKAAFQATGLPYYSPHTFRHMIVSEMYRRRLSIVQFKAWSQSLGHEGAMTTLTSYGTLSLEEQGRLISDNTSVNDELLQQAAQLLHSLKKSGTSA